MKYFFQKASFLAAIILITQSCVSPKENTSLCTFNINRDVWLVHHNQKIYEGIDNPVSLFIAQCDFDSIELWSSNATFSPLYGKCDFMMHPSTTGRITVYYRLFKFGSCFSDDSLECQISTLPNPTIDVLLLEGASIKSNLIYGSEIRAQINNLEVDLPCKVRSFCVIRFSDGKKLTACSDSQAFTMDQLLLMDSVNESGVIIFDQVVVQMPNGSIRTVDPVVYKATKKG